MATTTFAGYIKPRITGAISEARTSAFTGYVPIRVSSGLYYAGVQSTNSRGKKNGFPEASVPFVDDNKCITPMWRMALVNDMSKRRLGGISFPTVPDLAGYVTINQFNDAQASQAAAIAALQMQLANAQTLATLVEVVKNSGAAGATQIPPPQLAPAETNAPTINTNPFPQEGGQGGGGGD